LTYFSEEPEVAQENGNGNSRGQLGSAVTQKIGISLVDDDVGIVFKVPVASSLSSNVMTPFSVVL
jgi:hypothetical protein